MANFTKLHMRIRQQTCLGFRSYSTMPVRCYGLILNNYFLDYVEFHYRKDINDDIGRHLHFFFCPSTSKSKQNDGTPNHVIILCMYQQQLIVSCFLTVVPFKTPWPFDMSMNLHSVTIFFSSKNRMIFVSYCIHNYRFLLPGKIVVSIYTNASNLNFCLKW
jgi:hypothetical protein